MMIKSYIQRCGALINGAQCTQLGPLTAQQNLIGLFVSGAATASAFSKPFVDEL